MRGLITIGITGVSSEVGAAVARRARAQGCQVIALGRRASPPSRRFDLHEPISKGLLDGIDVVIHLAWDWSEGGSLPTVNSIGSLALLDHAAQRRVPVVLLSSFSAFSPRSSRYGAEKRMLEDAVARHGGSSVRAGLIWGGDRPHGIVATLARLAGVPVICPHLWPDPLLYQSHVDATAGELVSRALGPQSGVRTGLAAFHEPLRLSTLVHSLRGDGKAIHLQVPTRALILGSRAIERAGLRLPFRSDSLSVTTDAISRTGVPRKWQDSFVHNFPPNTAFLRWLQTQAGESRCGL